MRRTPLIARATVLVTALLIAATSLPAAKRTSFAILVNPKAMQNLSKADLLRVLRGDMRFWSNHKPIRIILPPRTSTADFERVLRPLMNVDVAAYLRSWDVKRAGGQVTTVPMVAPDDQMAIRAVVTDPSFLVIIDAGHMSSIPPAMRPSVQILTVDGKGPDAEGYVLSATD